jgi:hypothetical protein
LVQAAGSGGYLWVFADKIRLRHTGFRGAWTKGVWKGDKEIWIDSITGIQWRDTGSMWLGHIQFTLQGGSNDATSPAQDENALMFNRDQRSSFVAAKESIERRMGELRSGRQAAPASAPASIPDQICQLAELRDAGVLTSDEFRSEEARAASPDVIVATLHR